MYIGHVRLSDFGLSVALKKEDKYKIKHRAGTPGYMSPELMMGAFYGKPSDLYSLGNLKTI